VNATEQSEISRYLDGVKAALADLPPSVRTDMLEDLADHLAEVAAEDGGPLSDRLGPPEAYAAELRAAAGYGPARRLPGGNVVAHLTAAAGTLDHRLGQFMGYGRASEFGRLLRPGWWILRGYLAAMLFFGVFASRSFGVLPPGDLRAVVWLGVVALAMVVSVRLGTVSTHWRGWPAWLTAGANALLAVALLGGVATYSGRVLFTEPAATYGGPSSDTSRRVFPYDKQGRPLRDVRLVDEYGNDVYFGDSYECTYQPNPDGPPVPPLYPACGRNAPYPTITPYPEPVPTATPTAPPTASPTPTPPAPSRSVTPSPSPRG
jgi:hypothetical protein